VNVLIVGENKIHFIPGMIGPFLGVTLVPQVEVRNIMIPIFHDMMDWEQRKNGNFKQVNKLSPYLLQETAVLKVGSSSARLYDDRVEIFSLYWMCECRWRLNWLTSSIVWCLRGKVMRTTENSSVCCKEHRVELLFACTLPPASLCF